MKNLLECQKKTSSISEQELIEMGQKARQERDRLLQERPQLIAFQKEIDRRLENAGSIENRMAVLEIMILDRLQALQKQLALIL